MEARWCHLLEDCRCGGRRYGLPSGNQFRLPLDTCLFCDVNDLIDYGSAGFGVSAEAVALLDAEIARLAATTR